MSDYFHFVWDALTSPTPSCLVWALFGAFIGFLRGTHIATPKSSPKMESER